MYLNLAGENLKTIVNGSALGRVTSLVVDEAGKRIYWADGAKQRIGSSDFNGGKQRFINTNTNVQYIALLGVSSHLKIRNWNFDYHYFLQLY